MTAAEPAPQLTARRPLRIALLGYRSHPHVGGQGVYLRRLSRALAARGHRVTVISGPPYPELDPAVNLVRLPSLDLYNHPAPWRALRWRHWRSWADLAEYWGKLSGAFSEPYAFAERASAYLRRHGGDFDLIHDNQCLANGMLRIQQLGLPLVTTIHHPISRDRALALAAASRWGEKLLVRRWYGFVAMQRRVARQLAHIHTVSTVSKADIAADFGVDPARIQVIPNGLDTERFHPAARAGDPYALITTASADQPLKGLAVLLRALAALLPAHPQLRLTVIGRLNPDSATGPLLRELRLTDSVRFVSGLSEDALVAEYQRAGLAVVPSLYEGFGFPALEAMACGVPLVSSDGGALPEVVGDAATVVPAGDVDALAGALAQLLTDSEARERWRLRGLARARQFSWDRVGAEMEAYYRRLLAPAADVDEPAPMHSQEAAGGNR